MMATIAPSLSLSRPRLPAGGVAEFPGDLAAWAEENALLHIVRASASHAGGSWLNLVDTRGEATESDDLLVLICYCYLRTVYHSMDVVRRLDEDPALAGLRSRLALRPEQVRRFRRDRRRALTDSLTRSLVALWREKTGAALPISGEPTRPLDFSFLEPFYLTAQDRIDRAVVLDSMALDY